MKVSTKYNIGQIIQFYRPIKLVKGKTLKVEIHVGIIDKIRIDEYGIKYSAPSGGGLGFAGLIEEDDIIRVLAASVAPHIKIC